MEAEAKVYYFHKDNHSLLRVLLWQRRQNPKGKIKQDKSREGGKP